MLKIKQLSLMYSRNMFEANLYINRFSFTLAIEYSWMSLLYFIFIIVIPFFPRRLYISNGLLT